MTERLNPGSRMECRFHGTQKPSFVCHHLKNGIGLGFHEPEGEPDPDVPFKNAWCSECDRILLDQDDEWNDVSEGFAQVQVICEGCFEDIRKRNYTFGDE